MIIEIHDLASPELSVYRNLTEAKLKTDHSLFIAESINVINAALEAGCEPVSMLAERRHIEGKAAELANRLKSVPVYTADDSALEQLTGYEMHRGVLCAFKRPVSPDFDSLISDAKTLCVLEGLADSTNLGAIFRSAAAFGADCVLLDNCCDPLSRRALRVSTGNIFKVPWAVCPKDWISRLHEKGFATIALALTDDSLSLDDESLRKHEKRALVLGNEGLGLRPETVKSCRCTVKIPMKQGVDSLNVSAAAAVALWELRSR